jgi:hypothetical protein
LKSKLPNGFTLILVIAIALVLSSSGPQADNLASLDPNLYDLSWLTGKPCGAPCWYGLEPGVSSREDSISKAKQIPFVDGNTASPYYDSVSFHYKKPRDSNSVQLIFKNDILNWIWFSPSYPVTFEQTVEKLGNPDGYEIWLTPGGLYAGCRLDVIWEKKSLMLEYATGDISIISLGPNIDLCGNNGKQPFPKGLLVDTVYIQIPSFIVSLKNGGAAFNPWHGFVK